MALNRVLEQGRLVADPELRTIGDGVSVTTIRIAVDRDRVDKATNERLADFFDVNVWRSTAEFVCKYFKKGDAIIVDGRLQARSYEDKQGNKRTAIEIVADNCYFAGSKPGAQNGSAGRAVDDELPF